MYPVVMSIRTLNSRLVFFAPNVLQLLTNNGDLTCDHYIPERCGCHYCGNRYSYHNKRGTVECIDIVGGSTIHV